MQKIRHYNLAIIGFSEIKTLQKLNANSWIQVAELQLEPNAKKINQILKNYYLVRTRFFGIQKFPFQNFYT